MIGLFLGEKNLPLEILKSLKKKKIKYFIIDLSKNNKFKKNRNSYFINIGKFGKILELIKSKKCKKVLFAGNIIKPRISKLKLDLKGFYYIPRIIKASKLGDAAILKELIKILSENKIKVIIAGAGGAAHLPGMVSALTCIPVLAVPVKSRFIDGLDSLLSIVQMPYGVPTATFAVGEAGAKNAALFAVSILSIYDNSLFKKLTNWRKKLTNSVNTEPQSLNEEK